MLGTRLVETLLAVFPATTPIVINGNSGNVTMKSLEHLRAACVSMAALVMTFDRGQRHDVLVGGDAMTFSPEDWEMIC